MDANKVKELKLTAAKMRKLILEGVFNAKSGHPGGSLSATDIIANLYFNEMNVKVDEPKWADRDRFVMSKGHGAPALYAALALKGFFPEEDMKTLRKADSYLEGHPNMNCIPGVDMSTGSLGQGLSAALGMELARKLDGKNYYVYSVLGDGEIQEGQIWEAAMAAAHYKANHLIAFLDHNGLQIDGNITDVMSPEPVTDKFAAFGWFVQVVDGHDFAALEAAVAAAKAQSEGADAKPSMIICETVKGKGVSFMENKASWHGVAPKAEEKAQADAELDAVIKELEGC